MLRTRRSAPHRSPMESYFAQINDTPLLRAEEEHDLAFRVQEGDSEARDQMVRANLRLVVNIARGYQGKGVDLQDLIAEGNLGLLRAVEAFDPARGVRFSTYASFWIKQSIKRVVINTGKSVRLPAYMVQLLTDWRRAAALLEEELGRSPLEEEVAGRMGLSAKKLKILRKALRIHNAGPQGVAVDAEETLDEVLADERTASPEAALSRADDLQHVLRLLDGMDEREATVLRLRFGLSGEDPMTLIEIGSRLGLTRERVRQIEREALDKLGESIGAA